MSKNKEHIRAFESLAHQLRTSLYLNVQALQAHRGTTIEPVLEDQLEHTLQRIARLYGHGPYEHLPLREVFTIAIEAETTLAQEYQDEQHRLSAIDAAQRNALIQAAERHLLRARALAKAMAGLGYRDHLQGLPFIMPSRGVYIAPFSEQAQLFLHQKDVRYMDWNEGVLALILDQDLEELQSHADVVALLYFDGQELHHAAESLDPTELDRELRQRLADAQAAGDRAIGDIFADHINRLLLQQSIVLRSLQELLAAEHPAVATALQPLIDENRTLLEAGLLAHPSWAPADTTGAHDSLRQLARAEQALQAHATAWSERWRADDAAGLLYKFDRFVAAGSRVERLDQAIKHATPQS